MGLNWAPGGDNSLSAVLSLGGWAPGARSSGGLGVALVVVTRSDGERLLRDEHRRLVTCISRFDGIVSIISLPSLHQHHINNSFHDNPKAMLATHNAA